MAKFVFSFNLAGHVKKQTALISNVAAIAWWVLYTVATCGSVCLTLPPGVCQHCGGRTAKELGHTICLKCGHIKTDSVKVGSLLCSHLSDCFQHCLLGLWSVVIAVFDCLYSSSYASLILSMSGALP